MEVVQTPIAGVLLVKPKVWGDQRGYFVETWQQQRYQMAGMTVPFVQDNHSRSSANVLRGLHYQIEHAQGKLVRVIHGEVFDVAVDLRRSSPSFGQWTGHYLSAANKRQLWVPAGFAHGFLVVSETAELLYKTTDFYRPEHERCIAWDDDAIGIDWPLAAHGIDAPLLSDKDRAALPLSEAECFE